MIQIEIKIFKSNKKIFFLIYVFLIIKNIKIDFVPSKFSIININTKEE